MGDPVYKKKFGINTPIQYLEDSVVEKGKEKLFKETWKRTLKKLKPNLSVTREEKFEAYFRRLERMGNDDYYSNRVAIKFISKKVGYGVFAKEHISPYSTLCHYTGKYRLDQDIDPENDSTFTFTDFKLFSIDAKDQGNWARFMNHAEAAAVNVIAWEYYTKERPYIVFTAGPKGVKKNEQLLYSYGDDYWHEGSFSKLKR